MTKYKSSLGPFRSKLSETVFVNKYKHEGCNTWYDLAKTLVNDVCRDKMSNDEKGELIQYISDMKFIPGGRYLYYAGRPTKFFNNCFLLKAEEDTREDWAMKSWQAESCLMTGGGIGIDYSIYRDSKKTLSKTGGMSCLTGDTIVYKDRKKKRGYNEISILDLFNMREDLLSKVRLRSLDEQTGMFFRNKLLAVIDNGFSEVYEIKTENGYRIKATGNHRFMKDDGEYYHLSEFDEGESIAVNGSDKEMTGSHKYLAFDKIISIKHTGRERVFDLSMEGPNHNFIANGFVSHNSGPIPKMFMINEIGRNVMQGGSRRSAIYASLNWKHGDIQEFLVAKDWHNMPVAGTNGLTVWDLKNADFNYKAPLDMTNISVNYDTEWWLNYKKSGDVGDVFRKNVEQALKTGEPGFSFNFFDKEKETLRNALN